MRVPLDFHHGWVGSMQPMLLGHTPGASAPVIPPPCSSLRPRVVRWLCGGGALGGGTTVPVAAA